MRTRGRALRPAERTALAAARGGAVFAIALLVACATPPRGEAPSSVALPLAAPAGPRATALGAELAAIAAAQLGIPYRYGGSARDGFDCSGLVFYAHAAVGLRIPRTVAGQFASARAVSPADLAAGDLVFFRLHAARTDHVGIYLGEGRFVHAPARGRAVRLAALNDPYYAARYAGAGRFWGAPAPP